MRCACCGSEMREERRLGRTAVVRCEGCGISDTARLDPGAGS